MWGKTHQLLQAYIQIIKINFKADASVFLKTRMIIEKRWGCTAVNYISKAVLVF
jgi:hypothetical protein